MSEQDAVLKMPSGRTAWRLGSRFHAFLAEKYWRNGLELRSLPRGQQLLAALAIGTVVGSVLLLVGYLYFSSLSQPTIGYSLGGSEYLVPAVAFYFAACVYAAGWALLVVGATYGNPLVFGIVALYFLIYFSPFGFSLGAAHSSLFALPAWLIIALGLILASRSKAIDRTHEKLALLGLAVALPFAAVVILASFPFRTWLPADLRLWAGIPFGLALALLFVLNPISISRKLNIVSTTVFGLGFIAFFVAFSLLTAPSREEALANAVLSFELVLPFVAIFWVLLGASALKEAVSITDLVLDSLTICLSRRILLPIAIVLWLIEAALWPRLGIGEQFLDSFGWDLPIGLWLALELHGVIAAILAVGALWLAMKKRLSDNLLSAMLSLWLLSGLVTHTYYGNLFELAGAGETALNWTLAVFALGIFSDLYKGGATFANRGSRSFPRIARLYVYLGLLLVVAAISHLELSAHLPTFTRQAALSSFDGATYLGVPMVAYALLARREALPQIPGSALLKLLSFGALVTIFGYLVQNVGLTDLLLPAYVAAGAVAVQECLKLVALWHGQAFIYRLHHRFELLVASIAIGLGAATLTVHPLAPIPFVPAAWQAPAGAIRELDWPWTLFVYVSHLSAAAILAFGSAQFLLAQKRQRNYHRWLILATTIVIATVFRVLFGLFFTRWQETLYSTGIVWLYVTLPLLVVVAVLLWSLAPITPQIGQARRKLLTVTSLIITVIAGLTAVLWYEARLIDYPLPDAAIQFRYPANWQVEASDGTGLLALQRTFRFGRGSVSLLSQPLPIGVPLQRYVSTIEQRLSGSLTQLTIKEQQQTTTETFVVEKRVYRWRDDHSPEHLDTVSATAYYLIIGDRGVTLWSQASPGYERDVDWDAQRMLNSIQKH